MCDRPSMMEIDCQQAWRQLSLAIDYSTTAGRRTTPGGSSSGGTTRGRRPAHRHPSLSSRPWSSSAPSSYHYYASSSFTPPSFLDPPAVSGAESSWKKEPNDSLLLTLQIIDSALAIIGTSECEDEEIQVDEDHVIATTTLMEYVLKEENAAHFPVHDMEDDPIANLPSTPPPPIHNAHHDHHGANRNRAERRGSKKKNGDALPSERCRVSVNRPETTITTVESTEGASTTTDNHGVTTIVQGDDHKQEKDQDQDDHLE